MQTTRMYEYIYANYTHSFIIEQGALSADVLWQEADQLGLEKGWGSPILITHRLIQTSNVERPKLDLKPLTVSAFTRRAVGQQQEVGTPTNPQEEM